MRTIFALLLLAGTAAPAIAEPGDGDRQSRREARQEARAEARAERSATTERSNDSDRPHFRRGGSSSTDNDRGSPPPAVQVESGGSGPTEVRARRFRGFPGGSDGGERPAIQPSGDTAADSSDTVRNWRMNERRSSGPKIVMPGNIPTGDRTAPTLRQSDRPLPHVLRNRVPIVSSTPREGTQPPLRAEHRSRDRDHNWSTSWRRDHRYDWQNHRHRHRSLFHLGFYYDPFGWSYRPYSIGWRLWPSYYSSRYWISDPWQYRLPYAPPGYRWIRYWDDALLVDTFTGEVVDVIHNFFW